MIDLEVEEPKKLERKKNCCDLIRLILRSHQRYGVSRRSPCVEADDHYRVLHYGDIRLSRVLKSIKDIGGTIPNDVDQVESYLKTYHLGDKPLEHRDLNSWQSTTCMAFEAVHEEFQPYNHKLVNMKHQVAPKRALSE
jgi:hypothetical protein